MNSFLIKKTSNRKSHFNVLPWTENCIKSLNTDNNLNVVSYNQHLFYSDEIHKDLSTEWGKHKFGTMTDCWLKRKEKLHKLYANRNFNDFFAYKLNWCKK